MPQDRGVAAVEDDDRVVGEDLARDLAHVPRQHGRAAVLQVLGEVGLGLVELLSELRHEGLAGRYVGLAQRVRARPR